MTVLDDRPVPTGSRVTAPPVGYVDPIAVERACWGEPVRLRPRERTAAVQVLTGRGLSAREIGERVGCSSRTVQRHRGKRLVEVPTHG